MDKFIRHYKGLISPVIILGSSIKEVRTALTRLVRYRDPPPPPKLNKKARKLQYILYKIMTGNPCVVGSSPTPPERTGSSVGRATKFL